MAKYHISKDGTPGVCHAQNGNCPLGGADQHYPTMEAAQAAADERGMAGFINNEQKEKTSKGSVATSAPAAGLSALKREMDKPYTAQHEGLKMSDLPDWEQNAIRDVKMPSNVAIVGPNKFTTAERLELANIGGTKTASIMAVVSDLDKYGDAPVEKLMDRQHPVDIDNSKKIAMSKNQFMNTLSTFSRLGAKRYSNSSGIYNYPDNTSARDIIMKTQATNETDVAADGATYHMAVEYARNIKHMSNDEIVKLSQGDGVVNMLQKENNLTKTQMRKPERIGRTMAFKEMGIEQPKDMGKRKSVAQQMHQNDFDTYLENNRGNYDKEKVQKYLDENFKDGKWRLTESEDRRYNHPGLTDYSGEWKDYSINR